MVDFNKPNGIEFMDVVYFLKKEFETIQVQVVSKKAIKDKYYDRLKQDLLYV